MFFQELKNFFDQYEVRTRVEVGPLTVALVLVSLFVVYKTFGPK